MIRPVLCVAIKLPTRPFSLHGRPKHPCLRSSWESEREKKLQCRIHPRLKSARIPNSRSSKKPLCVRFERNCLRKDSSLRKGTRSVLNMIAFYCKYGTRFSALDKLHTYCRRFLRARKFNLKNTKIMLKNCIDWRKTVQGVGIDELYRKIDPYDVSFSILVLHHLVSIVSSILNGLMSSNIGPFGTIR